WREARSLRSLESARSARWRAQRLALPPTTASKASVPPTTARAAAVQPTTMARHAAIDHDQTLLTDDPRGETQAQLDDQLRRRGLFFGERPLCNVLRPRFLTPDQYRFLKARCALLLRAFGKVYDAALADEGFRRQFRLMDWEEALIRHDPG